ncbi:hypothetical protein PV762_23475 [Mitsuaria sp. CC2]|uniref:hypothetical protein n=1 Tax=Mitsuaria sp. CC2 TaxID=3029186 RepID=UPI001205DF3A|nr:MAG: hypothetical protein EOP37_12055 [Rubrivivax sp.]
MLDKKQYHEVLLGLKAIATIEATHKRLTKIETLTQDAQLKALLKPCLELQHKAFVVAQIRKLQGQKSQLNLGVAPYRELAAYCERCIASATPEWQIIATQNGWKR